MIIIMWHLRMVFRKGSLLYTKKWKNIWAFANINITSLAVLVLFWPIKQNSKHRKSSFHFNNFDNDDFQSLKLFYILPTKNIWYSW